MKFKNSLAAIFLSALLLTLLFHKQGIGLNLIFFEIIYLGWLFVSKQVTFKNKIEILCFSGFLLTGIFTVISYSLYGYIIHFLALFVFVGVLNYNKVRSLIAALGIAFLALFTTQSIFFKQVSDSKFRGNNLGNILRKTRIFVVPLLIIFLFITIYSFSNSVFSGLVGDIGLVIENGLNFLFTYINVLLIFTFLISLVISVFLLTRTTNKSIVKSDTEAGEFLERIRIRRKRYFKLPALKSEYKAAVFLLFVLNIIILVLNAIDIYWVWFNFEWAGQTLKEFVHEGTYLLILSIFISIAIVLYFFRGNLNFYQNNSLLKYLGLIWLFQNCILAISVAIRNFWYIDIFALAYKRIGVMIFLMLTLYGLYTVIIKVKDKKSPFYLFKSNALALYMVLVVSSILNWDYIIANYNFKHANESYLDLNYLSDFSDKTLPILARSETELKGIETFQNKTFPDDKHKIDSSEYLHIIANRKLQFKKKWEAKNLLSWNLPEYLAYKKLERK